MTERESQSGGPVLRLLVVDDNEDSAETLATLLRLFGYVAEVATDGPSALSITARERPDVILIDLAMPGMDGFELAEKIKALLAPASMVLAAVSGYIRDVDRRRSADAGFERHFAKPVDLGELRAWLATVALRRCYT
jgi:CheY-like chemotaxis protein